MKVKNLLTMCGVTAAILFTAGSLFAQDNGGGNGGGGGGQGGMRRFRGNGGGGGGGGQGGGGGNFDPAQMQQRMMQRYQDGLAITNDTEWSAIQPLVQKVVDARMAAGAGRFGRGGFGRGQGGPGGGGGGNNPFNQPNPERDALQKAIDDNAPTSQIKDLLAKYESSQKAKQAKLVAAQGDLRKVLTVKQEASATLMGLLD